MKSILSVLVLLAAFSINAHAKDICEEQLKERILFAYNDGGMQSTQVLGPFSEQQAFFDQHGNPGLKSFVTYVVSYKWDKEFNKPSGTVKITAECATDAEPIYLVDTNKDGIFDLSDANIVKSSGN